MGVALLDLVETALRVAKQALGNRAGKPDSGGLAREAHIVAHCIRKEEGHSYAEAETANEWLRSFAFACNQLI